MLFPTVKDRAGSTAEAPQSALELSQKRDTQLTQNPPTPRTEIRAPVKSSPFPELAGEKLSVSFEQVPLPGFIDAVFGETLKLNYQVDPQVAARTDLVTLRTGGERDRDTILAITRDVLKTYGVNVVYAGEVMRIVPDAANASEIPEMVRGRTSPEVPSGLRPVFQYLEITNVGAGDVAQWLQFAFGTKIKLQATGGTNNAILIFGVADDVRAAVDAARMLDQPKMAGKRSIRVEPVFWTASKFAEKLVEVLKAEGFSAATGAGIAAINIVAVEPSNAVLIFTQDEKGLEHASRWAKDLDRPARADPLRTIFVYPVKNTTAASLGTVLGAVLGSGTGTGGGGGMTQSTPVPPSLASSGQTTTSAPAAGIATSSASSAGASALGGSLPDGSAYVIDEARNAIIFRGNAETYAQIRPLLESLDQIPREALIEVTVAEVSLDDATQLGIEWAMALDPGNGYTGTAGTRLFSVGTSADGTTTANVGGLGIGTAGFNYAILNSLGRTRAILNALSKDNRVSIKSTPRLLARSGAEAQIQVGTEVPIITSQATPSSAPTGGSGIVQQVQYRTTGSILRVRPIVHAGNRIDLEIAQEVSEAQVNDTSSVSSPTIFNRKVQTQLSLKDGATVLLGGLISENRNFTNTGIPFLKDIPILGNAFRGQSLRNRKTELLIFITPFVIQGAEDSEAIANQFRTRMQGWDVPGQTLRP